MAHVGKGIPDDLLPNILSKLPGKSLMRFRCVSKHWKRLITDPEFIKSRSRRMILLSTSTSLIHLLDHNLSSINDHLNHSVVNFSPPFKQSKGTKITVVGTVNGIVVLLLNNHTKKRGSCLFSPQKTATSRLILYNPLTRASKEIPNPLPDPPYNDATNRIIGFGYGATPDDLKIVGTFDDFHSELKLWYVFDLKKNSWSGRSFFNIPAYSFQDHMEGTCVNGFFYWVAYDGIEKVILALNVEEMVFSKIDLPHECNFMVHSLGSLNGCLSFINTTDYTRFDVWMMVKEEEEGVIKNSWSKVSSFALGLQGSGRNVFYPVRILDHGGILMADGSTRHFIYDTSKHSSKSLVSVKFKNFGIVRGIEYVESFVSPSDMC